MELIIQVGGNRGYLTLEEMYSNGKQIRLITALDGLSVRYKRVLDGAIQEDEQMCKLQTFESWAKWKVIKKNW